MHGGEDKMMSSPYLPSSIMTSVIAHNCVFLILHNSYMLSFCTSIAQQIFVNFTQRMHIHTYA